MSFTFPNRYKEYKTISNDIIDELSSYSHNDLLSVIDDKLNYYEDKILSVDTELNRVRYEIYIDIYKKNLEGLLNNNLTDFDENSTWIGYPEITDPNFNLKIFNKKEFRNHQIEKQQLVKFTQKTSYFKKTPSQEFVGTYMSPFTPYNGLLLWHGVGVGKTCAGISSAENYRKFGTVNGKIIILVPNDGLITTWRDEIFNIVKELEKNKNVNVQCTGNTYIEELGNFTDLTKEQKIRRANRLIDKYYEFYGYRSFSNLIKKEMTELIKNSTVKEYLKIRYIKRKFSNRVFIFDEVHFTRQYANSDDNKDIAIFLDMIARYGENNKFIMASATPMYNSCEEIISIINLLLLNDKRAPIEVNDVFEKDGYTLNENGAKILKEKSRGYISYLRGENPITFPVKIYPYIDGLSYQPNPVHYLKKKSKVVLDDSLKIKHMGFIRAHMSKFQYKGYLKALNGDNTDESKSDNFSIPSTLASNICYPKVGDINWGDDGFNQCFDFKRSNKENKTNSKYIPKDVAREKDGKLFLDITHIGNYSQKYKNVLDIVMNSNGIVFIYSKYIKPGVLTIALALEQNGYKRFSVHNSNVNLLETSGVMRRCYCGKLENDDIHSTGNLPNHQFKQGAYILLYGETGQKELAKLISYSNDISNIDGRNIKFILGTNRVEQGVSFFNVREVHILDPWHHFNRTEQVVGRAIRQISHKNLPPEKKNVSVFLHCSSIPKEYLEIDEKNVETTDEKTYRNAYFKAKKIAEVTRLLKRNAVDCLLNKNGNQLTVAYFGNVQNLIETSQGIMLKDTYFGDKDGDVICDFIECEYDCNGETTDKVYVIKPNEDTYSDILSLEDITDAKNLISILFQIKDSYKLTEIIDIKNKNFPKISNSFIYKALNDYIYFKETIFDKYHRNGYLIYRDNYYIYQPTELDINNISLTIRSLPLKIRPTDFAISEINSDLVKVKKKAPKTIKNLVISDVEDSYITLFKKYLQNVINYVAKDRVFGKLGNPKYSTFKINFDDLNCKTTELMKNIPNCSLPEQTIKDFFMQYMIFGLFDRLDYTNKLKVFKHVLTKNIQNGGKCSDDKIDNLLETMLFRMYDKKCPNDNRYTIYRRRRDFDLTSPNGDLPYAFKLYNHNLPVENQEVYFMYSENEFIEVDFTKMDQFKKFNYSIDKVSLNNNKDIYGYVQQKDKISNKKKAQQEDVGIDVFEIAFYLVNRSGHTTRNNKDGSTQYKSEIKGAVCGTAIGSKSKDELIDIIRQLLEFDKLYDTDLQSKSKAFVDEMGSKQIKHGKSKHTDPNTLVQNVNDIETYKFLSENSSLCELIELLLRHRQYLDPLGNWFYNFEEWSFLRNLRRKTMVDAKESFKQDKASIKKSKQEAKKLAKQQQKENAKKEKKTTYEKKKSK